uniref:Uncharacterized protein n=1 Tax=Anguilla anguilla TaxID=7936 RepID=A0A0E9XD43_ANGAN
MFTFCQKQEKKRNR